MELIFEEIYRINEIMNNSSKDLILEELLFEELLLTEQPLSILRKVEQFATDKIEQILDRYVATGLDRKFEIKLEELIRKNSRTDSGRQLLRNFLRDVSESNKSFAETFVNDHVNTFDRWIDQVYKGNMVKGLEALERNYGKNVRKYYEKLRPEGKTLQRIKSALAQKWEKIPYMTPSMVQALDKKYSGWAKEFYKFKEGLTSYFRNSADLMEETVSLAKTLEVSDSFTQTAILEKMSVNLQALASKQKIFFESFDRWVNTIPDFDLKYLIKQQKGYNKVKSMFDNKEEWLKIAGDFNTRKKNVRNAIGLMVTKIDLSFGLLKTGLKPFSILKLILNDEFKTKEYQQSLLEVMRLPKFKEFKMDMVWGMTLTKKQIGKYYEFFGPIKTAGLIGKELAYGLFICTSILAVLDIITDILSVPISKIYPESWIGYETIIKNAKSFDSHFGKVDPTKITWLEKQTDKITEPLWRGAANFCAKFLSYFTDILSTQKGYFPGMADNLLRAITSLYNSILSLKPYTKEEYENARKATKDKVDSVKKEVQPIIDTIGNKIDSAKAVIDSGKTVTPVTGPEVPTNKTYTRKDFAQFFNDSTGRAPFSSVPNEDSMYQGRDANDLWEYCEKNQKFVRNLSDCK